MWIFAIAPDHVRVITDERSRIGFCMGQARHSQGQSSGQQDRRRVFCVHIHVAISLNVAEAYSEPGTGSTNWEMRMLCRRFAPALVMVAACSTASAGSLVKAYADKSRNVHVVTASGKDIRLTKDRRADEVRLAPDGESAAWVALSYFPADGRKWPTELHVYRNGRTRSIECGGIIREYWYWKNGTHVATDCGGLHFSGIETLYEVRSMKEVDSFDQAEVPVEKRPEWSTADRQTE